MALDQLAKAEFQFIWRSLRRLGVWPEDVVDDAAQHVFEVAAKKWHQAEPGRERAFLYRIAVFTAAEQRRARRVGQREQANDAVVSAASHEGHDPDALCQERQYRAHLDAVLAELTDELREVFVLYEIEQLSCVEIADLLEMKVGTVSSRLRRARECFHEAAARLRARLQFQGQWP